jgi:hypothetical protein
MDTPQGEQPTPEEAEAFEKTSLAALDLLHNEKTRDNVQAMLQKGAQDPARTLGVTAANIVSQLDDKSGNNLPIEIIPHVAGWLVSELAEVANASQAFPVDENVIGKAGHHMTQRVAELYGADMEDAQAAVGSVNEEERNQIVEQQSAFEGGPFSG